MMRKRSDYDLVIVGAGLAGLTLACCLGDQQLRIAIIDQHAAGEQRGRHSSEAADQHPYELCVSAITMGSQQCLEQHQVWQNLDKTALAPFQAIEVWKSDSAPRLSFRAADLGQPHLGSIVGNTELRTALLARIRNRTNVDWFFTDSVKTIQTQGPPLRFILTSGQAIGTHLLVGADGIRSHIRKLAHIHSKTWDYQQQAIVATVHTSSAHNNTARQIFLPTGPLALLPLPDPQACSIVWSTTVEQAEDLKTLSNASFCSALSQASEYCLGEIIWASDRLGFPLTAHQCDTYVKPSIALIGDAAHALHPLAGQGANLGIADAQYLAQVLLEAQQKQRALGAVHTLRRYERARRFHNCFMGHGVDLIQHAFASKSPLLKNLCVLGVRSLNRASWVKNQIALYAMGQPRISAISTL